MLTVFLRLLMVGYFCLWAYRIRLSAATLEGTGAHKHFVSPANSEPVHDYGYLIHEFDPWPAP